MAAGYSGVNLELQHTDTYPLLMDHHALGSEHGHVTSIMPDTSESLDEYKGSRPANLPSSPRENIVISIDVPSISPASTPSQEHMNLPATSSLGRSISASSHSQLIPAASSSRRSRSSGRHTDTNGYSTQQRTNPLNSGLWISIDMVITVGQIIASIIVLSLSRDENPHAPLALWVMGYAAGCLAMLPLLYWRYTHRHARQLDRDSLASSAASSSSAPSSPHTAHPLSQHTSQQGEELEGVLPAAGGRQVPNGGDSRYLEMITVHMERFKIALDCFFAVWFVVGNVWIFGGHSSSHEAPNLYRLCIVFLMFSCISYAMPFVICATVCCCLPCIITLLSYREDHAQAKGAAPEVIAGLPIYKFKTTDSSGKGCKDGNDSDCENPGEGGIFAPGTDKERVVSGEDAVCCICLGKYKDGMDLKELQCAHFFHVECVDKWLKINATCPLCKHELGDSDGDDQREQLMT